MSQLQNWEEIIKIQPRGVITIPRRFRGGEFGENNLVRVRKAGGNLVLEPVTTLKYTVRRYTDTEVEEFLDEDKRETDELRKKGILK